MPILAMHGTADKITSYTVRLAMHAMKTLHVILHAVLHGTMMRSMLQCAPRKWPCKYPSLPSASLMLAGPDHACQEVRKCAWVHAAAGATSLLLPLQAVKRLLESARSQDKELKEFPGGYHELLMGPEKAEAAQMLIDWLGRHSPDPPAKL